MGLKSWISGIFASGDRSPWGSFWFEPVGAHTSSGMRVTADGSMQLSAVFAAVRIISSQFASLPFVLYRNRPDGGKDRVTNHPIYSLIARRPNQYQNAFEWREMMAGHLALRGNAFNQIVSNARGQITALIPLHPDRVKILLQENGDYSYQYSDLQGQEIPFSRGEIWHLRGLSSDGIIGLSPIALARNSIGGAIAAQDFGTRFFANDAKPTGGWVEYPGSFKDKQSREQFRESLQEAQSGVNHGKVAVFEYGMKYHQISISPDDAQFLETRKFQVTDIARWFGVPPHKIGDLSACMPANTLVFTKNGPKRIVDIKPGDMVWSFDGTKILLSAVLNNWDNGTDEILEFKTTNRTVRCNAQHRLLVRRAVERNLENGEIGGRNTKSGKVRVYWKNQYVRADEIIVGDTLVALSGLPDVGETRAPNGRALTVGFMEFCGLLVGDGNVFDWGVSIADMYGVSTDTVHNIFAGRSLAKLGAVSDISSIKLTDGRNQTKFNSVTAAQELQSFGFGGTAYTKRIPGWVFELTEELRLAFLRGIVDSDGTVDKKGRITVAMVNKHLIEQLRCLCMSCGVPVTNVRTSTTTKWPPLSKKPVTVTLYAFTCSDPGANIRIGSHDARYIERMNTGKRFDRKDRAYPRHGGKGFAGDGVALSRVVSIERRAPEPVYDIEVENHHCFIADGVVSHNSTNNNIEQQAQEFVQETLGPMAERWEASIEAELLFDDEGIEAEFLFSQLLRGDSVARATYYNMGINGGWLTRNQARISENMNPLPGLDAPLRPLNMAEEGQPVAGAPVPKATPPTKGVEQPDASTRLASVLQANAARIARRIVKSGVSQDDAPIISDSLAVPLAAAQAWCDLNGISVSKDEQSITASLIRLASSNQNEE